MEIARVLAGKAESKSRREIKYAAIFLNQRVTV
jgi:hypothetical protein